MHSPSTMLWRRRNCSGSAGCARLTAKAILSAFQYETKATTAPMTRATTMATMPLPNTAPKAAPTSARTTTKPATRATLRRLFDLIRSYMKRCSEVDGGRRPGGLVGLEVLASIELQHAGEVHRGELLQLVVVLEHRVVVELPGVGHPPLGGRELF